MNIISPAVFLMTEDNIHGREILTALLQSKINIDAVIVERGSRLAENTKNYLKNDFYNPKSFKDIISNTNINVHYVTSHNNQESVFYLKFYKPKYIVLGGVRILNTSVINTASSGVLNAHPAILPKYQGLDCVAWSIVNNDHVGATVHFINEGIDSGPIILQDTISLEGCSSLIEVRIKAMKKCAELMPNSILGLCSGELNPVQQDHSLATKHPSFPLENLSKISNILCGKQEYL